jgi:hypothetical protein
MGATVVMHKSQTGTVPFLQERGLTPLKRSRSQKKIEGKIKGCVPFI